MIDTAARSSRRIRSMGSVYASAIPASVAAFCAFSRVRLQIAATSQPSERKPGTWTCAPKPTPMMPILRGDEGTNCSGWAITERSNITALILPTRRSGQSRCFDFGRQLGQRQYFDSSVQRIPLRSGIDYVEPAQGEVFHRYAHRFGDCWRVRVLHLDTITLASDREEQIELCAGLRGPEVGVALACRQNRLFEDEPFPGRPELRVSFESREVAQSEQRMHDPAVADEDLGRPYLALADIDEPRLQLTNHERGGEDIELALDRRVSFAERSADLGRVPDLPV